MENHPIPQDIQSFQFKLVGSMTLKQFGFFGAGMVIGWITISLPIPVIIRYPFGILFALSGFLTAFIPFDGRPLDVMIALFFQALFSPNQYVFIKSGGHFDLPELPEKKETIQQTPRRSVDELQTLISNLPHKPKTDLDQREAAFLQKLSFPLTPGAMPQVPKPPQELIPSAPQEQKQTPQQNQIHIEPKEKKKEPLHVSLPQLDERKETNKKEEQQSFSQKPRIVTAEEATETKKYSTSDKTEIADGKKINEQKILEKEVDTLKKELEEAKKEEKNKDQSKAEAEQSHQKVLELEQQLQSFAAEKQKLEQKLAELSKQLEESRKNKNVYTPTELKEKKETKNVRVVPKPLAPKVGLPIAPDTPNVISGIVKDARGNVLPNILVEIKDADGNPVRAFKTNSLGLFASATPLQNGTYTIQFEDPGEQQKFDVVEIKVTGVVISPLEVLSTDAREELRKELFG